MLEETEKPKRTENQIAHIPKDHLYIGIALIFAVGVATGQMLPHPDSSQEKGYTAITFFDGGYSYKRISQNEYEVADTRGSVKLPDDLQAYLNKGIQLAQEKYRCKIISTEINEHDHTVIITLENPDCIVQARDANLAQK